MKQRNQKRGFYRFVTGIFGLFFRTFYRFEVFGREHIPVGGAVIVANHTSYFDPPILSVAFPEELHYLAKASLFKYPIFGAFIRKLNAHPIRGNVRDLQIFRTIARLIDEKKKIILFPEGTRAVNYRVSPLKRGVALMISRSKAPVIPVYIHGAHEAWSRKRAFPRLKGALKVVIGTPIYWESFNHLPDKQAQMALLDTIRGAFERLQSWLENGATGFPP